MASRAQVLDLLRKNAVYGDLTGSTQGAGYMGGAYIGGCMNCMNAGCMACGYGRPSKGLRHCVKLKRGPKGKKRCSKYEVGPKSLRHCVKSKIGPSGKKRCAKYEMGPHGGYRGMADDLYYLLDKHYPGIEKPCSWTNRENKDHYSSVDLANAMKSLRLEGKRIKKFRSRNLDAANARKSMREYYCDPTPEQQRARTQFALDAKAVSALMREGLTRQQAWDSLKMHEGPINLRPSRR